MKRFCTVVLLGVLSIGGCVPALANTKPWPQSRAARKADKKQQRAQKKYNKAARKAQRRMIKQSRKNARMYPSHR